MYYIIAKKDNGLEYAAVCANKRDLEKLVKKYPQIFNKAAIRKDKWDKEDNAIVASIKGIRLWVLVSMSAKTCMTPEEYMDEFNIKYDESGTSARKIPIGGKPSGLMKKVPIRKPVKKAYASTNKDYETMHLGGADRLLKLYGTLEEAVLELSTGTLYLYSVDRGEYVTLPVKRFTQVDDISNFKRIL